MSLHLDTTKCKNKEAVWDDEAGEGDGDFTSLAITVMYMCMFIGLHEVTEKNANEWYYRASMWEKLFGAHRKHFGDRDDIESIFLSRDEVNACIGLHTNSNVMTDAQYVKHVGKCFKRRCDDELRAIKRNRERDEEKSA